MIAAVLATVQGVAQENISPAVAPAIAIPFPPNDLPAPSNLQMGDPRLIPNNSIAPMQTRVWSFNFTKAPWGPVLREFSKLMDLPLTMQSQPTGDFTYFDNRSYTPEQAIDIFNDHLIPQGCVLVLREGSLVLLSIAEPIRDEYVTFVSVDQIDRIGRNTLAGAAIPVTGIDVGVALQEVEAIKSPLGKVKPFTHTGRLLVIDTGTHLRRIRDLLMQTGFARRDLTSTVYQLHHAKSELVAKVVQDFLTEGTQSGGLANSPIAPAQYTLLLKRQRTACYSAVLKKVCKSFRSWLQTWIALLAKY